MPGHIKLVKGAVDPDPTEFLAMVTDLVADVCTLRRRWSGGDARYSDDDELLRYRLCELEARSQQ